MKYLLVVAHPDDEVLGAGASMWKWCKNGDTVDVAIMCTEAKARAFRPDDKELEDDTHNAIKSLGVNNIYEATFPNIEMNTVPHLKLDVYYVKHASFFGDIKLIVWTVLAILYTACGKYPQWMHEKLVAYSETVK